MSLAMPRMTSAVKLLLILNVAAFVLTDVVLGFGAGGRVRVMELFALVPGAWAAWFPFVPVWQLVTYGFLHAGLGHILGNLLFLYFLGTMLEGIIGARRFWVFYLGAVVIAGFFQLVVGFLTSPAPILGASGGVLAIVCAMATLRPQTRIIFIILPITLKTLAIFYVLFDALNVVHQLQGSGSNVASIAHLTGAAVGFFAVRRGWIWRDPLEALGRARVQRAAESEADRRARLDALLAKINREGIGTLNGREKAFLKKMSKRG
jgi:membrane associated rhomboid family serine protease